MVMVVGDSGDDRKTEHYNDAGDTSVKVMIYFDDDDSDSCD